MKIIVQKFGGTSVQTDKSRQLAFSHIKNAIDAGYKSVVVVSAIGRRGDPYATDTLLELIGGKQTLLSPREQDMLLSVGETISCCIFTNMLKEKGVQACCFSGVGAGVKTTKDHLQAKILEVDASRLSRALATHDVAVVAGFQGFSEETGDMTTIGRGGSDTSAAALGVALQAEFVDIYTDVDGVMTADPRIVEHARSLSHVSYKEVSNMAYEGAKVIHPRAVEIAMTGKIPMRIRSTYQEGKGTLITNLNEEKNHFDINERTVTGIAHVAHLTQFKLETKNALHSQETMFNLMAKAGISLDFINITTGGIIFTVPEEKKDKVEKLLTEKRFSFSKKENCAKVSIVGAGITGVPGITAKIVSALSTKGITILQSADSYTTIWVLVKGEDLNQAVNALHDAFCLTE